MSRGRLRPKSWAALVSVGALAVALAWAAAPSLPGTPPLAAMLPQGALMTVESADFGALVDAWSRSPEERAWRGSASYSAFANSRLFARLENAQSGFADAARRSVDGEFLREVAGGESILAWYDIGNLEFLYISHLPQGRLDKLSLLAQRGNFARREAGGTAFYVRTSGGGNAASVPAGTVQSGESADAGRSEASGYPVGQTRTVAFAVRGDWLLLATREDLIAGALQLMAAGTGANGGSASQVTEGWYAAAAAAGPTHRGDLHMLLDLQKLARTPQFRTYWIQRNVTATRQYRAAVVDLYREPGQFREERVLLPLQPGAAIVDETDLGSLEDLVPERAGVYRASAHPQSTDALSALEDKVLVREPAPEANQTVSPETSTTAPFAGSAGDFDTHIDAPRPPARSAAERFTELQRVLEVSGLESMLTIDRTDATAKEDGFVRIHSAVVLQSASAWDKGALSAAVLASLRSRLTTASLGLRWAPATVAGREYLVLSAAAPVCLSMDGRLAIVSSDPALIEDILRRRARPQGSPLQARQLAGFQHDGERTSFRRLTADLNVPRSEPGTSALGNSGPHPMDLFGDNLPSLSEAFQTMASEHFLETADAEKVHQTVVYRWTGP